MAWCFSVHLSLTFLFGNVGMKGVPARNRSPGHGFFPASDSKSLSPTSRRSPASWVGTHGRRPAGSGQLGAPDSGAGGPEVSSPVSAVGGPKSAHGTDMTCILFWCVDTRSTYRFHAFYMLFVVVTYYIYIYTCTCCIHRIHLHMYTHYIFAQSTFTHRVDGSLTLAMRIWRLIQANTDTVQHQLGPPVAPFHPFWEKNAPRYQNGPPKNTSGTDLF